MGLTQAEYDHLPDKLQTYNHERLFSAWVRDAFIRKIVNKVGTDV